MKRLPEGAYKVVDNRLLAVWFVTNTRTVLRQSKRVPNGYIPEKVRQAYLSTKNTKSGDKIAAIRVARELLFKNGPNSLRHAVDYVNEKLGE